MCRRRVYFKDVVSRGIFFGCGGGGGRRRDCVEGLFLNRVVFIMSLNEEDPLFVEMPRL